MDAKSRAASSCSPQMREAIIMGRYAVIAGLLFAYSTSAGYAQLSDAYINGVGYDTSCGHYIAEAHNLPPGYRGEKRFVDDHTRHLDWLQGFITGVTVWALKDVSVPIKTDPAALDLWIRKWCKQNPTKNVFDAAWAFVWDQRAIRR
jgi:hypothetical protein